MIMINENENEEKLSISRVRDIEVIKFIVWN